MPERYKVSELMYDADKIFKNIISRIDSDFHLQSDTELSLLRRGLITDPFSTEKKTVFSKIQKYFHGDRSIRILDYGCGSGQLLLYLHLLGYRRIYGIDVATRSKNLKLFKQMGAELFFIKYDGSKLPFTDGCFDLIISEQVLEHVFNVDDYYREAARVLKNNGLAFFSFPHKMIPFDSHSRTWFIHFFPKRLRRVMYKIAGKDPKRLENYLNFKTIGYHKRIGRKYFKRIFDETKERLLFFDQSDFQRYEGDVFIRGLFDKMMKSKAVGSIVVRMLSKLSNVDLCLLK